MAASSTIYQLSKNPDKQEKLFKELKAIFPNPNVKIDQNVLERIPYLRACIKETLRYVLKFFLYNFLIYVSKIKYIQQICGDFCYKLLKRGSEK